jgi:hypothetical protein
MAGGSHKTDSMPLTDKEIKPLKLNCSSRKANAKRPATGAV